MFKLNKKESKIRYLKNREKIYTNYILGKGRKAMKMVQVTKKKN